MPQNRARAVLVSAMCLLLLAPAGAALAADGDRNSSTGVTLGRTSANLARNGGTTRLGVAGTSATVTRGRSGTRVTVQSPPSGRRARTRTTVQRGRWAAMAASRSEALRKLHEARKLQADRRRLAEEQVSRLRRGR